MVTVAGRTLLEHQIRLCKRFGLEDIILLTGHLAHVIYDHFLDGAYLGVKLTHVVEPRALGTAGSVNLLKFLINDRFLVLYGDIIMDMDLNRLIQFDGLHPSSGTLVVHPNNHPYDSDLVEMNEDCWITAFHSKPRPPGGYYQNLVNAAAYILSPDIFDWIDSNTPSDFGRDIFPNAVRNGVKFRGYLTSEYIHDVGTAERVQHVTHDLENGKIARRNLSHSQAAIFLDRDGVLVDFVDHLTKPEELNLSKDASLAVSMINQSDYLAVVVTNQPMLAKGFMDRDTLKVIHNKMETLLGDNRAYLDSIYYCPHHPESGFPGEIVSLKIECQCRKPRPGMLLKASRDLNIDLSRSWMIGDQETDLIAGKNAGCRTIFINPAKQGHPMADAHFSSLLEAVTFILNIGN